MRRRRFFQQHIQRFLAASVLPGSVVLYVGGETTTILRALQPRHGILLTKAGDLPAGRDGEIEVVRGHLFDWAPPAAPLDYVIFHDYLHYENQLYELFQQLKTLVTPDTKIIILSINPLQLRAFRLLAGLRISVSPGDRNILALEDIHNLLDLCDYEVLDAGFRFLVPFDLPLISFVGNAVVPRLPVLRQLCFGHYTVCRPRRHERRRLSCSVVVPCYNEEGNVAQCIARIPEMGSQREIVVVDDGSRDRTAEIVRDIAAQRSDVRLISYERNSGKGYAMKVGWDNSRGDVLMMLDCDMTTPPEELALFHQVMEDGAEFINGTRVIYPREKKALGVLNRIGVTLFATLISWITQQRISDTFCGTKVFLRRYWPYIELREYLWGDWDLFFSAKRYRMKMVELPVHYYARRAGKAKMRALRHGSILFFRALRGLAVIR